MRANKYIVKDKSVIYIAHLLIGELARYGLESYRTLDRYEKPHDGLRGADAVDVFVKGFDKTNWSFKVRKPLSCYPYIIARCPMVMIDKTIKANNQYLCRDDGTINFELCVDEWLMRALRHRLNKIGANVTIKFD